MAYTSADYLAAIPQFKLTRPRGDTDPFAKVYCMKCNGLRIYDELDLDAQDLDPAWFLCEDCKVAVEEVMPPEE